VDKAECVVFVADVVVVVVADVSVDLVDVAGFGRQT